MSEKIPEFQKIAPNGTISKIRENLFLVRWPDKVPYSYVNWSGAIVLSIDFVRTSPAYKRALSMLGLRESNMLGKWVFHSEKPGSSLEVSFESVEGYTILSDAAFYGDRFILESVLTSGPNSRKVPIEALSVMIDFWSVSIKDLLRLRDEGKISGDVTPVFKKAASRLVRDILEGRFDIFDANTGYSGALAPNDIDRLHSIGIIGSEERSIAKKAFLKKREEMLAIEKILCGTSKDCAILKKALQK